MLGLGFEIFAIFISWLSKILKPFLRMHLFKPEINQGFGFEVETCCGAISYSNQWNPNWPDFYFETRLRRLVNMLKSEELKKLFETLILKKSEFFEGLEITPSIGRSRLKSSLYMIRL